MENKIPLKQRHEYKIEIVPFSDQNVPKNFLELIKEFNVFPAIYLKFLQIFNII